MPFVLEVCKDLPQSAAFPFADVSMALIAAMDTSLRARFSDILHNETDGDAYGVMYKYRFKAYTPMDTCRICVSVCEGRPSFARMEFCGGRDHPHRWFPIAISDIVTWFEGFTMQYAAIRITEIHLRVHYSEDTFGMAHDPEAQRGIAWVLQRYRRTIGDAPSLTSLPLLYWVHPCTMAGWNVYLDQTYDHWTESDLFWLRAYITRTQHWAFFPIQQTCYLYIGAMIRSRVRHLVHVYWLLKRATRDAHCGFRVWCDDQIFTTLEMLTGLSRGWLYAFLQEHSNHHRNEHAAWTLETFHTTLNEPARKKPKID